MFDFNFGNDIYIDFATDFGVLIRTASYWYWVGYCDKMVLNDEILSVTIKLGSEYKWSTTGATDAYDVQTVVLHELGHALGVAHCHEKEEGDGPCWSATCLTNVMNPSGTTGKTNTTLKEYDTASYIVIYW